MATKENNIEVLNDLIRINNDRVVGYTKATEELKDEDNDLRVVFQSFILSSKRHISELTELVLKNGGEPAHDSTAAGKIYHAWMDVKATFTGNDLLSILNACEYGEDAAQRSYKTAIEDSEEVSSEVLELIRDQKASLKKEHDAVREYRDSVKVTK
ncbi:MAG: family four-helix-bundle protein [Cytophagaceae bacterium]|jgi:uncharacterized protein (TIGR02284 family)|nr:family four-helix-bundle protein [Cytophagaceae bacterium]